MRNALLLLLCFLLAGHASAVERVVSERIYKQLTRVHALMDDEEYDQALERLQGIRRSAKRPYAQALVRQISGYLYAAKEQYPQAIEAFVQCLALQALPQSATKNTLYALTQLQISVADYSAAIDSLEQWFKLERRPTAQAHGLAGTAYAQAKRYASAIEHLRKAVASADAAGERWYQQLLAIYYDTKNYQAAARLLEEMTGRFPERKAYWMQLSSVYRTLNNDARSLAVLELVYRNGLLNKEQELVELVGYYLYMDMPYKAGDLLERALQDGRVAPSGSHWKLLSDAWLRARELQRARNALQQASILTQEAEVYLRLARLDSQINDWSAALQAINKSLQLSGLKQPGKAYILQGMAHYNRRDYPAAKASFERAGNYAADKDQARIWLDYICCG